MIGMGSKIHAARHRADRMRLSSEERDELWRARTDEFKAGVISEEVYRASLFALMYRGENIDAEVRRHQPVPSVPDWVGVVARAIALKALQNKRMTLAEWERFVATLWKDNACAR